MIAAVCMMACACTQSPDYRQFISDMYEHTMYEDYDFLEEHCSKALLEKLESLYDYDGEGYAVWEFRSGEQDGPSNEHGIISIESVGDGWYKYTATDMGVVFSRQIKLSHKGNKVVIDDIAE